MAVDKCTHNVCMSKAHNAAILGALLQAMKFETKPLCNTLSEDIAIASSDRSTKLTLAPRTNLCTKFLDTKLRDASTHLSASGINNMS